MIKYKYFSIKDYVTFLIAIFILCSLLTSSYFIFTFENVRINGTLYSEIKESTDLKAEILPPKMYIIESYLYIHQIINEGDRWEVLNLLAKIERQRYEYYESYDLWKSDVKDPEVYDVLFVSSHEYVVRFYKIFDEEFLPALYHDDTVKLQTIVNTKIDPLFKLHKAKITAASYMLEETNTNIETSAERTVNTSFRILFLFYLFSLAFLIWVSILFFKRIKDIENKIMLSKKETENANARLENIIIGLRRFKHNFDNILASIKGYTTAKNYDDLDHYINGIIIDKNQSEIKNYVSLDLLKSPGLLGLVMSKLVYAEKSGVDFKIIITDEITEKNLDANHLCEATGILLDNAIEAAFKSNEKKVILVISNNPSQLSIEIQNSVDLAPEYNKLFPRGWNSKEDSRGAGLYILNDLISKHQNFVLNTFINETTVKQEFLILKTTQQDN